ncbi:hypothetical protein STRDD11_01338 [Streptococcus sp. DD11]|uniref:hypothetical protein n=1 Tax=Streptococcus sp. DD11 TaxID=1777879 RepID=UPI000795AF4C|nr:hypothetical protein [Streptococcus sp. DD11]KXT83721.1 hypothetical protein STRDD11_01338 [Streptococcus sp. DD11]
MNQNIRIILFVLAGLVLSLIEQTSGFLRRLLLIDFYIGAWGIAVLIFAAGPAIVEILKEDKDGTH